MKIWDILAFIGFICLVGAVVSCSLYYSGRVEYLVENYKPVVVRHE